MANFKLIQSCIKAKKEHSFTTVTLERVSKRTFGRFIRKTSLHEIEQYTPCTSTNSGEVTVLIDNMRKTFENSELAKKVLISSGVYDKDLKLTPSFKR